MAARIKAIIRRHEYVPNQIVSHNGLKLDKSGSRVCFQDNSVELTAIEYNLLDKLSTSPGKIFRRGDLMDSAYEDGRIVNDRTVDSHMKKIRKKLNEIAPDKKFLHSIYGIGYKFEP